MVVTQSYFSNSCAGLYFTEVHAQYCIRFRNNRPFLFREVFHEFGFIASCQIIIFLLILKIVVVQKTVLMILICYFSVPV